MAAATCPNGHPSESTDYCDTCGSPLGSVGAAPAKAAPAPADQPKPIGVVCPNCAVMNAPGALFCEACGYDYTTGTMPRPPEPSILDLDTPLPDADTPDQLAGTSAQPSPPDASPTPEGDAAPSAEGPDVTPTAPPAPPMPSPPASALDAPTGGRWASPAADLDEATESFEWVLEIWVDPEWYSLQESPDPMPSPGLPEIVPLRKRSLLIGRPSRSRNIRPDVDCEPDTGISRRQAQLTTDGTRWFNADLGSANVTFVADASGGMPNTPIPTGRRRELSGDERIFLGAWTRLVLRRATPEEQETYAST